MEKRIRVGKLEKLQQKLTALSARERLQWAGHLFGQRAVATACLGADCAVMLHMLAAASPESRVFVIAPGDLSPETTDAVAAMEERLGLSVTLLDPYAPSDGRPGVAVDSGDGLTLALEDAFCWISDARAAQPFANPNAGVLERLEDGLYQLNPLFDWSDAEVEAYREAHDLPRPSHGGWRAALQSRTQWAASH